MPAAAVHPWTGSVLDSSHANWSTSVEYYALPQQPLVPASAFASYISKASSSKPLALAHYAKAELALFLVQSQSGTLQALMLHLHLDQPTPPCRHQLHHLVAMLDYSDSPQSGWLSYSTHYSTTTQHLQSAGAAFATAHDTVQNNITAAGAS